MVKTFVAKKNVSAKAAEKAKTYGGLTGISLCSPTNSVTFTYPSFICFS